MSRLLRMVAAVAAQCVAMLLFSVGAAVADGSPWTAFAAALGVALAVGIGVQMVVSAAIQTDDARQRRFAAYLHELDKVAADGRAES